MQKQKQKLKMEIEVWDIDVEQILKPAILAFFKPYFQEQMHKEAVEELEVVDNSNTDTNS